VQASLETGIRLLQTTLGSVGTTAHLGLASLCGLEGLLHLPAHLIKVLVILPSPIPHPLFGLLSLLLQGLQVVAAQQQQLRDQPL
jgi:hypothetical protein